MKSDPTLSGLTLADRSRLLRMARARNVARSRSELPPVEPGAREDRVPLSFAQQRLWFVEQLGDLGSTYHIRSPLRLRGALDRGALVRALDGMVARHESLRTTFAQVDGIPEQRIAPADARGFRLGEHDLAGRADAEAELARLVVEEGRARFDLERGPLVRGRLIRMGEDDHVLLLTMHHLVSDGWSMGVFFGELSALYGAHREGREPELAPLAVQYADYAAWQRRWVEGDVLQAQADYWARALAGAPELLALPTDHPRPAHADHAGAVVEVALDEALTAGVRALSRRHGTTPFMTLLAAWAVVLGRLSGQGDVVVGTPTAGRGRREIEGIIGFFVSTLALRLELSDGPTVAGLLERVKARVLEAQNHQDIPFEQVVERVDPARSLAHHPVYQALFSWQTAPGAGGVSLPGLEADAVAAAPSEVQANVDLSLALREAGGRIVGGVTYATALFARETVERWAGYLRRALEEMVADDARPVDRLALVPDDERARVLDEWNRTEAEYPAESCIHHLVEAQAARTPEAEAVVFGDERLAYGALNARANRLAHHLRARGVRPDARVAICVERSPEMVVGLLAILKAGGAYVPLDPSYPDDRLAHMLADSAPAAVLTQGRFRGRVAAAGVPVLVLDDAVPAWAHEPAADPARGALSPAHAAYVIYTSGSTGTPKGVAVEHRAVVSQLAWAQRTWALGADEAVLQRISHSFDVSVREIFWPLSVGARLVLAPPGTHNDPAALVSLVASEGIGVVHTVPSLLQALLEHPDVGTCTGLARVMCGGEVLSPALAKRFHERLPGAALYHMYGPTEATVAATAARARPEALDARLPLGRPVANTRAYVLDARGEPVPLGAAGELYLGGAQLARGYLGRPAQTAERFVADPFGREPGARLYRTGDRVRWRPDGVLEFLGRTDHQVKVRGFRIEPGEIEARLAEHAGVREAVVVAREDAAGDTRLVAYVAGDDAPGADVLRAHAAAALPDPMVPAAYVRLDAFPLTPNGKVDRAALPAPDADAFAARAYEPPAGDVEELLAGIWAGVLRVERVSRWDHFFALGGHSLLAVQVISRVRQVLGVEVALGEIFTRPVLRDFARGLETAGRAALPPVEPVSRDGRIPLSFAQQRLWFLEQLGGLGSTYHMYGRLRLRGDLDRGALVRALDRIVDRHEALRTTFAQVDGAPEQRIAPAAESGFRLVEHDLSGDEAADAALARLMVDEARAPFDLRRGPLARGRLVRRAADDHVLLVTLHHIVSDGWSMGVLMEEISALYGAFHRGAPDPLPPLPVQYADFAAWQRRWVEGDVLQAQADYWTDALAGAPELLALPADRPRPAQMDHAGGRVEVRLDEELTSALKALSRRNGATLFMTVLAGWAAVLGRLAGQDEVVVGTPSAGRGRQEIEGLIGFFVNSLALRVDLAGAPTVAELLARVRARTLDAQHHQDIPFEQVVERVDPPRSLAYTPLFQAFFAWQNAPRGTFALPGLTPGPLDAPEDRGTAKHDVGLTLGEADGRIVGGITYAAALFERETIERYAGYLRRMLRAMAADDGGAVDRLPLLAADERARVLEAGNPVPAGPASDRCMHELFQAWAARTPDAVALEAGGRALGYAALNARANRLAHRLRARGVGPDVRVAVCAERSLEMVLGPLAVLKAGGACVPLDPAHPDARLRYMLEDSAPVLVLAQEAWAGRLAAMGVPVLPLEEDGDGPAEDPARGGLSADHVAYVIYTSGSTGRPKGVELPHRGLSTLVLAQDDCNDAGPGSRAMQFQSFGFDACVWDVFVPLGRGATLVVPPPDLRAGDALQDAVARHGITHMMLTTALAATLEPDARMASLRTLTIGGDALTGPVGRRWARGGRRVINGYGPTETTLASSFHLVRPDEPGDGGAPIGRPFPHGRIYVLDPRGEPVPAGVVGEMYIGGAGVARGYLGRPALTAEAFVPDPFGGRPGARLYRTGDLGRRRPDGTLEFAGRTDQQVKIRGFRVETGEVEARLAEHPAVREAAVVAREDAPGEKRLVAYCVAEAGVSAGALREHAAARLPDFMVPAAYVRLDALPLTRNGKLDRAALPAPDADAFAVRAWVAPASPVEAMLAEIWAEVLGVERVGRTDGFFALGGHSLLAVTLIERMRRQGLHADVRTVFAAPTLAALAEAVGGESGEVVVPPNLIPDGCTAITPEMLPLVSLTQRQIDAVAAAVPGGAANVQDIYPLAPLQEGLLFHHLVTPEGDPYLLGSVTRFDTRAQLDAHLQALRAVAARHDVLRTSLAWDDLPEPVQVVWRRAPLPVEEVEADPAGGDVAGQLYRRFDPRHHRLDLRRAPLMRCYFARDEAEGGWVLLLLFHHLIGDHTTGDVVTRELEALLAGRADELPDPLPFRTYVAQARLGVGADEHQAFFREMLGDVDEPTAPFGLLDVRGDGSGIDQARLAVDAGLAARLRARARALGVSAASLCHLAWAQVLAAVSGRDDVVFGTVLFGRMQGGEGADRVIGPFINTLPLRVRLGGAGAEESVRETHARLARLLRHEHATLTLAQRCSAVEPPAPLFTSLLNYRHGGAKTRAGARPSAAPAAADGTRKRYTEERSNYPLTMSVDDLGEGLSLTAKIRLRDQAARVCAMMHAALQGLVDALDSAPARPIGTLSVLAAEERARVLDEWNRTETEFPADALVHDRFQAHAARTPAAVALCFGGRALAYGELNARANRLAHHLRALGVGPDVRVGLCLERSLEMVVGLLGVMKAGGAYVPLDPGYPDERLRYMVDDSAPAVVLTQAAVRARVEGFGVPAIALDADADAWADRPDSDPPRGALTPDHLTHVIYTSGSTGRPKGVMMAHRGGVNRFQWMQRLHRLGVDDDGAMLQNSSFSFDASVWELLWPLSAGARVVLSPPQAHRDLDGLVETMRRWDVRAAFFVPSMLQLLLENGGLETTGLRRVMCGGEALPPALARRLEALIPGIEVYNMFGPSEASQAVTGRVRVAEGDATVPLGRPVPNTRIYVLDGSGMPAPVGVAGEIHVGGVQMARGYLGRPGLTAERFVPDPFVGGPGARLYRTGDLGRWREDGRIEFLGRMDFQVKVRGFRIELGEVEARLAAQPGVREAVVAAREDTPGDTRLVAYWVGEAVDPETLRAGLAAALPAYMVPTAWVRLDAWPRTPNGKLDRRALPAPESGAYAVRGHEAAEGETEQALAEIWAEVLGVERVGRGDDFFARGGHSLLAVRVVSRVRQVLGVEAALGELFARPVLADFARALETSARSPLPPIRPEPREGRVPLSFAQQRLWFLEQLGGLGSTYHIHKRLRLRGALDRMALVRALDAMVARHEALRTTFAQVDGVPEQRIAPPDAGFRLREHDLSGRADADAALDRLRVEEARAPFDLERGPLVRGRLVRLAADDHVLLVTSHHIVTDAWSSGIFFRELSDLYAAFREGRAPALPPLPVQYADYALWQRRWVGGEVLQAQAEYWTRTLRGAPERLELPTDHPRPARTDHAGELLRVDLDETLTSALKALSRRHGTTLFMTLMAGWAVVLARLSGQDDVVIGTPTANRGRREIEGLIGFFINTLAVRVDLAGSPAVPELLARVKARVLEAQHHQDIPFEQVVELVDPVRSLSHNPLYQVNLTWQSLPQGHGLSLPDVALDGVGRGSLQVSSVSDLGLEIAERNGRIRGVAIYATSLFERETVERHVGYLARVLEEMAADDGRPVERLALMSADERTRVVETWNRTEAGEPAASLVHAMFEAHAARAPEAEAIVFGDESLSYAALDARANRLAHHLRGLGIGPDARVGICVERGPDMVAAVLAVLKAGAAYVPLDPAYPADRLAYMLEDSAPAAVLSQASVLDALPDVLGRVRGDVPVLALDTDDAPWAHLPATDPTVDGLTPDHPAYVIYTSGSTGRPKGVVVPHRGLCNVAAAQQRAFGVGAGDRVLQFASLSFDAAAFEMTMALASGAALVVAPRHAVLPGPGLVDLLRDRAVSIVTLPPSALAALPDAELPALKTITVAGEALPAELVARWGARHRLVNLYGPTEATIWSTMAGCADPSRTPDIGHPVANVRAYVLDRAREPVPVGVAGELYVGGAGVARGYLGRPALTAERFVPDPFGGKAGARLYRTGDRVRRLRDGRLDFIGRVDHQVKVRGFRIEPGEIEARLAEHPAVREAVVVVREDAPGEKRIVAYLRGGEEATADVLRAYLEDRLPDYMVPAAYVPLEAWPLTPNGKLDRRALPAPEGGAFAGQAYEAPLGETEQALAEIWADVLGIERVGRHDNFFELGGHSLLAVQVIASMREIDLHMEVQALFEAPTLAALAAEVGRESREVAMPDYRIPRPEPAESTNQDIYL